MIIAVMPDNEQHRLAELLKYQILDTPRETEFNEIVQLASTICNAPISLISLLDADRQWFKASIGLSGEQNARDISFCSHAILQDDIFIVNDAILDNRFYDNPLVTANPNIRFYAGIPLITDQGYKIGTLSVLDKIPGNLTDDQKEAMRILGKQVIRQIELKLRNTELKEATKRDTLVKKEMQQIKDAEATLIYIMAHDIRGPLASTKSLINAISSGVIPIEEMPEIIGIIDKQMDKTLSLLNNIIDWGMAQVNKNTCDIGQIQLYNLVKEQLSNIGNRAIAQNNTLINKVAEGTILFADAKMLQFILKNLLENANRFTTDGTIIVSATVQKKQVLISVSDTGAGIPKQTKDKLFENGPGFGLALSKNFVDRHNGVMDIESTEGHGTTITITIPGITEISII